MDKVRTDIAKMDSGIKVQGAFTFAEVRRRRAPRAHHTTHTHRTPPLPHGFMPDKTAEEGVS